MFLSEILATIWCIKTYLYDPLPITQTTNYKGERKIWVPERASREEKKKDSQTNSSDTIHETNYQESLSFRNCQAIEQFTCKPAEVQVPNQDNVTIKQIQLTIFIHLIIAAWCSDGVRNQPFEEQKLDWLIKTVDTPGPLVNEKKM